MNFAETLLQKLSSLGLFCFKLEENCCKLYYQGDLWLGNICNENQTLQLRIFTENNQFLQNCKIVLPSGCKDEMFEMAFADDNFLQEAIRLTILGAEHKRRSAKIRHNFINRTRYLKKL